jgi:uncharacterized membrane protein YczE
VGKRIAVYLIGLMINALGIAFIIHSTVGAGAWDAVAIGVHHYIGFTIGICSIIVQVLVVIVTKIIDRNRIQYGAIIAITIRSMFLDAWNYLVFNHLESTASWELQWLYFVLGVISMGFGIGIYIEAHFPKSPIDGLMIALHQRFQWSINVSRIVAEVIGVLLGLLLGGPVGLGTLVLTFALGKMIQFTNSKIKRVLHKERVTDAVLLPQKF